MYITFPELNLKFLIDTGSTNSFVKPEVARKYFKEFIRNEKFRISTAHGSSIESFSTTIDCSKMFDITNKCPLKFYMFDFHKYFDGLLGLDNLKYLNVKIDLEKDTLITPYKQIQMDYYCNDDNNMNCMIVQPRTEQIIEINVANVRNGEVVIPYSKISNLEIPECIAEVKNGKAICSILNPNEKAIKISNLSPIQVEQFAEYELSPEGSNNNNNNFNNLNHFNVDKIKFDLSKVRTDHMNNEERNAILKLIKEYSDIFHIEGNKLTFTSKIKHNIRTTDEIPVYTKSYRYPYVHKNEVQTQIKKMLDQDIIRPSNSPWSSPIWIVPKKLDASGQRKWRIVVDYRKLNEKTIGDRYPLPNINDLLDKLGKCQYFTTLDLASGFHQIEMFKDDIEKTAFNTENGHYEFTRMPFGLRNAPATFQRVMDNILRGIQNERCLVYLDDIIIFSTSLQEHIERLGEVFERLRNANFKIQLDKSEFLRKEVAYLGHIVTPDGVKPNPDKIKAIQNFPLPKTAKQIKGFLGLLGYYRKFIKDFSKLTKPLTACLKKDSTINPKDPEYIKCFELCKNLLINEPILQYPNFEEPFILTTDASNFALGAVLSQGKIGSDLPVAYASRTLTTSEINYSTIEKEVLAIIYGVTYFRPYLFGRKFKIVTDHKPLQWLFSLKEPHSKLHRWRLKLEEYDYEIVYKKGSLNKNADALSRIQLNANETVPEKTDPPIFQYIQDFNRELATTSNNQNENIPSDLSNDSEYIEFKNIKSPITNNISEIIKDLLEMPSKYSLGHCVSADLAMSAGIAISFKKKFNNVAQLKSQNKNVGEVAILKDNKRFIFYLITKEHYYGKPTYESLWRCLKELRELVCKNNIKFLALPRLGCGLDQLQWSIVKPMINFIFRNITCEITVCKFKYRDNDDYLTEIQSIVAEPGDLQNNDELDDETDQTIHSNIEHPILCIPIVECPVNYGKNQIVISEVDHSPADISIIKLYRTKQRILVQFSKHNFEQEVIKFVKERIVPKVKYYLYFEDPIYEKFCNVLQTYFKNSEIEMIKCTKKLIDITDEDELLNTIQNYHEGKTNHRGIDETEKRIKAIYYWPLQKKTIEDYINKCEICLTTKYDRHPLKVEYNITPTATRPFQILHMDSITLENCKFLTIIDSFSKYAQAYKLNSAQAIEVANNLIKYFSHHCIPEQLISDNGLEFKNSVIKELLQTHKVKLHFISSQHPESNGMVERFHSTLIEHIRLFNNQKEFKNEPIEVKVNYAILAYNNTIHSATNLKPYEITTGHYDAENPFNIEIENQLVNNYVSNHKEKLKILYQKINQDLQNKKQKVIGKANENREQLPTEIPKTVYVKNKQSQGKTRNKYNKETLLETNEQLKTAKILARHGNTQSKIHLTNIKRPRKHTKKKPIPGPSSSSGNASK